MSSSDLPTLSSSQVRAVDQVCAERFGIPTEWLMEAAGWQIARLVTRPAVVVCGVGNNAGDGLAAARHLHRWGLLSGVCCVDIARLRGPAASQLEALRKQGVEPSEELDFGTAEVVLDAIFGTGLTRPPDGSFVEWIEAINGSERPVIAVDVPSGLDAESGVAYAPSVHAALTITLGLPKRGLEGEFIVVDIGIPADAFAAVGIELPAGAWEAIKR